MYTPYENDLLEEAITKQQKPETLREGLELFAAVISSEATLRAQINYNKVHAKGSIRTEICKRVLAAKEKR